MAHLTNVTWKLQCWLLPTVSQLHFHPSSFFAFHQAESLQTTFLDSLVSWLLVRFCQWKALVGVWKTKVKKKPSPIQSQLQEMPPGGKQGRQAPAQEMPILIALVAAPPVGLALVYGARSLSSEVVQFQQCQNSSEYRLMASTWSSSSSIISGITFSVLLHQPQLTSSH